MSHPNTQRFLLKLIFPLLVFFSSLDLSSASPLDIRVISPPKLNPNNNYLTAGFAYRTNVEATIRIFRDGQNVEIARSSPGLIHYLSVIDLSPNRPTRLLIEAFTQSGERIQWNITMRPAGQIPIRPRITITQSLGRGDPDQTYLIAKMGYNFIINEKGRILWANNKYSLVLRKLENGHLLVQTGPRRSSSSPLLQEVDLAGNVYQTYQVPNRIHHDAIPYENGVLLLSNSANPSKRVEGSGDLLIQSDRKNQFVNQWSMSRYFDILRPSLARFNKKYDWVHLNAIAYNEKKKTITLSSRNQGMVVGFTPNPNQRGAVKWILASQKPIKWKPPQSSKLLQIAEGDPPFSAHSISWLPNGNLLLYDNGVERQPKEYSRAAEYEIDERKLKAKLVRQFDYNRKYFTPITGDVHSLDDDTWLVFFAYFDPTLGKPSRLVKVNPSTNQILWEATIDRMNKKEYYYRAIPL